MQPYNYLTYLTYITYITLIVRISSLVAQLILNIYLSPRAVDDLTYSSHLFSPLLIEKTTCSNSHFIPTFHQ